MTVPSPDEKNTVADPSVGTSASLLVAAADMAELRGLGLPVALVEVSGSPGETRFRSAAGVELDPARVMVESIGSLALTARGRAELEDMAALWQERTGSPAPPVIPCAGADPSARRQAVLEWLVARLANERQAAAVRSARQMRELGILRRQHEETQAGFRNLEAFLYRNVSQKRVRDITLSPAAGQLPLVLQDGMRMVQRLPGESAGFSDIAIHVANETTPQDGVLHVSLSCLETGDTLAIWEIAGPQLRQGWLRLSLERALGSDAVTLMLSVSYQGGGTVRLSSSVRHPEPRFSAQINGQAMLNVPALQIWRWIAGASAPLAATSILPVGGKNRLRRVLGETLTTARDMNNPSSSMSLHRDTGALLVHVLEDRLAGAILSGVALPGARHVRADIRTYHPDAPRIEYRLALVAHSPHPRHAGEIPAFEPQLTSDWVCLAPEEDGQVHLILAEPLEQPCDVYMLTRLPDGVQSNSYGWSTFANLTLQY